MRPVYQSVIHQDHGDCLRACIASLLDLDSVPNFAASPSPSTALAEWLADHGLGYVQMSPWHKKGGSAFSAPDLLDWTYLVGVHAVASVPSQRFEGRSHAVVVAWSPGDMEGSVKLEVVHDPNPSNAPYDLGTTQISFLSFLVPRRPG